MTILFITAFPPCRKTAGQDYTRRLILDLLAKGHSVSLVYAEYSGHSAELPSGVKILGTVKPRFKNCLARPFIHPFFTRRFQKSAANLISRAASDFDILYFDFSQMHLYSLFAAHPRKILMCHDVIAQKFSRKGRWQLPFIKSSERLCLRSAGQILTFSKKDCDFIRKFYGLESTQVNFYLKQESFDYSQTEVHKDLFCFYGAWNRYENEESLLWFIKNVLPFVSEKIRFAVIGGGMSAKLKSKIESACLAKARFRVLGFVENPVSEIAKCQAMIAPLHKGAGVKVKVIDALTSGTSVIGTDVAFEGIEDNAENPLFFKKHYPKEFAETLNGWHSVSAADKQAAADEFFSRYDANHFADMV